MTQTAETLLYSAASEEVEESELVRQTEHIAQDVLYLYTHMPEGEETLGDLPDSSFITFERGADCIFFSREYLGDRKDYCLKLHLRADVRMALGEVQRLKPKAKPRDYFTGTHVAVEPVVGYLKASTIKEIGPMCHGAATLVKSLIEHSNNDE